MNIHNFKFYLRKATSLPPHIVAKKIWKKFVNKIKDKVQKQIELHTPTWTVCKVPIVKNYYIDISKLNLSGIDIKVAQYLIEMYLSHRFDLLGSGWVKNTYDSKPLGLEGYKYDMNVEFNLDELLRPAHLKRAKGIWQLIDKDYIPIDWQKDYKSGYRWNVKDWYKDTRKVIGRILGVDIKMPWELARMQHLPQLAVFSMICPEHKEKCIREFKNQVLDFIATNPPRMGVNWVCTMDVAIRAANMSIAYDMFNQLDTPRILTEEFRKIFAESIFEHGEFIVNNLEWSEWLTSNHYLANIAGLLFIGAYLDKEDWISFAYHEIANETKKQFYEDGGNFESSTSYHRLSGEMVIYSSALILRLLNNEKIKKIDYNISGHKFKMKKLYNEPVKFLPQWFIDKLYKIGRFTLDITKPNGEIPQIGDNDSGQFIKLSPNGKFLTNKEAEDIYLNLKGYNEIIKSYDNEDGLFWDENVLNHQTFISGVNGLFEDKIFKIYFSLEKSFVETLSEEAQLKVKDKSYKSVEVVKDLSLDLSDLKYKRVKKYEIPFSLDEHPVKIYFYPDSGIYILKNTRLYICFYCTPLGQNGNGGHTHNDKLSIELWIDREDILKDAGTYFYTPLPFRRNEFRSVKTHNTLIIDNLEQNDWFSENVISLFNLKKESECSIIEVQNNLIEIFLKYKNIFIIRELNLLKNKLLIIDKCNKRFKQNLRNYKYYSNGYGKILK